MGRGSPATPRVRCRIPRGSTPKCGALAALELLHLEYLQQHPDGYRYSAFCRAYREWLGRQRLSMRQVHKAGDKLLSTTQGSNRRSSI